MTELSHEEVLNVEKTDHPDLVGGIVWADCELNWIRSYGVRCHEAGAKSEREVSDRLLEALKDLVSGLDSATWSSWQTTARFQKQWDAASAVISEVEAMRKEKPE